MKALLFANLMFLHFSVYAVTEELNYKLVAEAKSQRMGKFVIRYMNLFQDMCLGHLQSLYNNNENQWVIYKSQSLCAINSESVAKDFTDASITDLNFEKDSIRMIISTTPLYPRTTSKNPMGKYLRNCTIEVNKGMFSPMKCDKPQRVGE